MWKEYVRNSSFFFPRERGTVFEEQEPFIGDPGSPLSAAESVRNRSSSVVPDQRDPER